jgi:surfeit locus 1 family protein
VEGLLMASQERGRFGPRDPAEGRLATLARADLQRLAQQVEEPLYPLYLQLGAQRPAPGDLPVVLPLPVRGDGPHLGYALQWFSFALLGVGAYLLLLRRTARQLDREADAADAPAPAALGTRPVAPSRPR